MEVTCSKNKIVQQLLEICYTYKLLHVVLSPGSRNAPLTISFTQNNIFTCYSIPDERSAAFFALGLAKQLQKPVAIICTSGTAVLNYAPAIAEAYYQEIPLVVITADRPPEWIDQEDGQTIHQANIYQNYVRHSVNLPIQQDTENVQKSRMLMVKAFEIANAKTKGPVHINFPFYEPLYETESVIFNKKELVVVNKKDDYSQLEKLKTVWANSEKILIVVGVLLPNNEINKLFAELIHNKNIVVIAPPYSNLQNDKIIDNPELLFNTISEEEKKQLQPNLLISFGGSVVSKATKLFLREYNPNQHFDVDYNRTRIDTYLSLSDKIILSDSEVVNYVNYNCLEKSKIYFESFLKLYNRKTKIAHSIIPTFPFCDLKIYQELFSSITKKTNLHFSNSTPIRYAEFFKTLKRVNYYCNRGTSGIDGNTSIALGAANANSETTVLVTGDVSFMYDSNAFWNKHIVPNFKVLLINNNGGNIFRIINGPAKTSALPYFETSPQHSVQKLCEAFSINYITCNNENDLTKSINNLLGSPVCTILEIFTPAAESAETYKEFFKKLREHV